MLEQELLEIARTQEVQETLATPHGIKYVIDGIVQAPQARPLQLRTVWIMDIGQTEPRFVTAHPLKPDSEGANHEPKA